MPEIALLAFTAIALTALAIPAVLAGGGVLAVVAWLRGGGMPFWLRAARAAFASLLPLLGALHVGVMLGAGLLVEAVPAPWTQAAMALWLGLFVLPFAGAAAIWRRGFVLGQARRIARHARTRVDVAAIRERLARLSGRAEQRIRGLCAGRSGVSRLDLEVALSTSRDDAGRLCRALEEVEALLAAGGRRAHPSGRTLMLLAERDRLQGALDAYAARLADLEVDALLASSMPAAFSFQKLETEGRLLQAQVAGARLAMATLG